jgi:3-dehydroquinate synthase
MSELFEVNCSSKSYHVTIKNGCATDEWLFHDDGNICIVVDKNVRVMWNEIFDDLNIPIFVLESNEENKTLLKAAEIIEWMRSVGMTKDGCLYAFGGGVVQDLATFVSSSYMRGIRWNYFPTTLLGMVDSCIGGKSSINVGGYKNIAGNFFPPDKIYIDDEFCQTLHKNEIIAGLVEGVKITYADSGKSFKEFLSYQIKNPKNFSKDSLSSLIGLTLKTKKIFVEADEFDGGIRQHLNFGHTVGHAIEASTNYRITHGVAVGVGMLAEIEISRHFGLRDDLVERSHDLIRYLRVILNQVDNLRENLKGISADVALSKFKADKKHTSDEYSLIMLDEQGFLRKTKVEKTIHNDEIIKNCFSDLIKFL